VEEIPIDPRLLAESEALENALGGSDGTHLDPMIEETILDSLQDSSSSGDGHISAAPLGFAKYFSSINVICNQGMITTRGWEARVHLYVGNSRDPPSRFVMSCPNAQYGCKYKTHENASLNQHGYTCPSTSPEAARKLNEPKQYKCTVENCPKSFPRKGALKQHVSDVHEFIPKPCPKGCDPSKVYLKPDPLKYHVKAAHTEQTGDAIQIQCTVPGCKSKHIFTKRSNYKEHLQCVHKLFRQAQSPYLKTKQPYTPHNRSFPGCADKTSAFSQPDSLRRHLKRKHECIGDEAEEYIY